MSPLTEADDAHWDAYNQRQGPPLVHVRCDLAGHRPGREVGLVYKTALGPLVESRRPFNTKENAATFKQDGKRLPPVFIPKHWFVTEAEVFTFHCDRHGALTVEQADMIDAVSRACANAVDVRITTKR